MSQCPYSRKRVRVESNPGLAVAVYACGPHKYSSLIHHRRKPTRRNHDLRHVSTETAGVEVDPAADVRYYGFFSATLDKTAQIGHHRCWTIWLLCRFKIVIAPAGRLARGGESPGGHV
jgi:hypothetical protein